MPGKVQGVLWWAESVNFRTYVLSCAAVLQCATYVVCCDNDQFQNCAFCTAQLLQSTLMAHVAVHAVLAFAGPPASMQPQHSTPLLPCSSGGSSLTRLFCTGPASLGV